MQITRISPVAILLPFLLLLLVNLYFSRKRKGLTPSELILIASMGMVSALTQGEWLAGYFLGVITAPIYFASPENGWADTLLTRLSNWSVVSDHHAAVAFYEGLPAGADFPWGSWIVPLFWWGCFFLAFYAANLCLMVVFRRQWMDYERLPFPLAAGLLELTGEHGQRGTLMDLLRNPRFKIGFFVALFLFGWDIVSWFTELIPPLQANIDRQIFIGEGFPYLRFKTNPLTIAFGYFTESNVLFSIWFFHLVMVLQVGLMNRLGFEMGSPDPWCSYHPAVGWQSFGGLLAFVLWGLWVARDHLAAVFRKAFTARGDDVDDSGELFSYRTAVFVFLGCVLFSVLFFLGTRAIGVGSTGFLGCDAGALPRAGAHYCGDGADLFEDADYRTGFYLACFGDNGYWADARDGARSGVHVFCRCEDDWRDDAGAYSASWSGNGAQPSEACAACCGHGVYRWRVGGFCVYHLSGQLHGGEL